LADQNEVNQMSEAAETQVCPHCAETIKAAAKVCPHCRYWQKKWSIFNPKWLMAAGLVMFVGYSIVMAALFDSIAGQGRDFAQYRDQIQVATSSMSFSSTETNRYVTTVGLLTNCSDFSWKEVQLEAQYFDAGGKLIDTGFDRYFDTVLLPHGEAAFRIRIVADKLESSYASHKVFVRFAKDGRNRF
jgi:hypothetical protein